VKNSDVTFLQTTNQSGGGDTLVSPLGSYMRKAIYLAAEAWRQAYNRASTGIEGDPDAKLEFKLPSTGDREHKQHKLLVFDGVFRYKGKG